MKSLKKVLILAIFVAISTGAFAQKGKVSAAQTQKTSGDLEKAIETIELTIDPTNPKAEKTIPWAKTWMVRGEIYSAAYKDAKLKESIGEPLNIALDSYKKAIELDTKGQFKHGLKIDLTTLSTMFSDQASNYYKASDFANAHEAFKKVLEVNALSTDDETYIDTSLIFNTGLTAYQAEMYDEAIEYFGEVATHGYQGADMYTYIMSAHINKGDTIGAIGALQEGFEKYPEAGNIVTNMVNLYIQKDMTDDAIKYLDIAIKQDPNNATFYFAQGALYDKMTDIEKAIASYEKAIELKSDYFDPHYNLGVVYFNKGVNKLTEAYEIPTSQAAKYEAEKAKAEAEFRKAVPYMLKASEINPKDTYALESLKQLYYRLNEAEKRAEVEAKLEELKAQ